MAAASSFAAPPPPSYPRLAGANRLIRLGAKRLPAGPRPPLSWLGRLALGLLVGSREKLHRIIFQHVWPSFILELDVKRVDVLVGFCRALAAGGGHVRGFA